MKKYLLLILASVLLYSFNTYAQKVVVCNQVGDFKEGLAPIQVGELWGFIDLTGNKVIDTKYLNYDAPYFSEGLCSVKDPAVNKVGYIDKSGNKVIPFQYNRAMPFSEGIALYSGSGLEKTNKNATAVGFIDTQGKIVTFNTKASINQSAWRLFKNKRMSYREDKSLQYGFLGTNGQPVIPPKYGESGSFSEGLAAVLSLENNNKWGFIDTTGKVIIDFQYANQPQDFSYQRAFVRGADLKWGLIDATGKILIGTVLDQAFPFAEGLAIVSARDTKGTEYFKIIDTDAKSVKEFKQTGKEKDIIGFHSGFSEGLAIASQGYGNNQGFIDTKGKVAIDYKFTKLRPFSNGLAYAEKTDPKTFKTTKGFIDKKGKFVIAIEAQ